MQLAATYESGGASVSGNEPPPSGTVTFLFSDVEGSTRLLQALGDRYDELIGAHNRLLRDVFARFGGREIGTEGDSFFVVFAHAGSAVEAAVEAQRALAAHRFPEGVRVRVRMGLHSGEGRVAGGTYVGLDVHRAARIAAAASGGQVLVSQATRVLSEAALGDAVRFTDLGEHRLKDLARPEHLYQVSAEGLERSFPRPTSVEGHPTNLAAPASSFVGRERELQQLKRLIAQNRLVTLTGTGGTGKTRLALEAGSQLLEQFPEGVFVVFLAGVSDADLVPSAIAQALGLQKQGVTSITETLERHLAGKRMLLILDNFEHLLPAAPLVAGFLGESPELRIVVTSRAALRLSAEQEFPVPPMSLPSPSSGLDPSQMERSEAVALFLQRVRSVRPDFRLTEANAGAVSEICLRLDGLPLALELAAARMRTLEPHQLAGRLNHSLDLLTHGSRDLPARQQTLRNTVAWSYDLLDPAQQSLFRQLGVFAGGFSLEAAESVCCEDSIDLLEGLAEHSLIESTIQGDGTRYRMLKPVREFAVERLESLGEAPATMLRHVQFFVAMAEEAGVQMQGPGQLEWLSRLETENDNLWAAMSWALEQSRHEEAARLGWGLWMFWWLHGYHQEGRRTMESLLSLDPPAPSRTIALAVAGNLALAAGDHQAARAWFRDAITLARQIGDRARLAVSLHSLGLSLLDGSELDEATACLEEALPFFVASGNGMMVSGIHTHLGTAALLAGDLERAEQQTRHGLVVARSSGDRVSTYFALYNLGQVALARGDAAGAAPLLEEGLALAREIGNQGRVSYFLESLAIAYGALGHFEKGSRLLGAAAGLKDAGEIATFNYLTPARAIYGPTVAEMKAAMGDAGYEEAQEEGRQLTLAQAVAYALEGQAAPSGRRPAEAAAAKGQGASDVGAERPEAGRRKNSRPTAPHTFGVAPERTGRAAELNHLARSLAGGAYRQGPMVFV